MNKTKFVLITTLLVVVFFVCTSGALGELLAIDNEDQGAEELATYIEASEKYTFRYPASWHTYEISGMPYVRLENIDARELNSLSDEERSEYFKIEVVVLPANGLSLGQWVEKQNTTSYPLSKVLEQQNMEVAGQPAIYQVEQFGSMIHPVIFISKGESIYILNILNTKEKYRAIVDDFIKNFEFNPQ